MTALFEKYKCKRTIASLLVIVMLVMSLPLNLVVYSNETGTTPGLGIINNAYAESSDRNYYQVTFYKLDGETLTPVSSPGFNIGGKTIDGDGYFDVANGASIDLLSYETIRNFIDSNQITQVKITFCETYTSDPKSYKFYSAAAPNGSGAAADNDNKSVTYTIQKEKQLVDDNDNPVFEDIIDENTGEVTGTKPVMVPVALSSNDYKLCTFTSSELVEHDVKVTWRDTGTTHRPLLSFDISRTVEGGSSESVSMPTPQPVNDTSNLSVYKYNVPKYNENHQLYTYTAELSSSADISSNGKEYRYTHTANTSDFTLYGKKSFDCEIKWLSGKRNLLPSTEPELGEYIKNYIYDNYDLYDGTDSGTPSKLDIDKSKITYTVDASSGVVSISISGLDEITDDGRAKVYYLQKKNNENIGIDGTDDEWKVNVENPGVYSAETEKVYQDATISNVITGTTDVDITVDWKDSGDKQTTRKGLSDAADILLWRYADRYDNDSDNIKRTAQADKKPVDGSNDTSTVSFTGLEKYDRFGYEYVYYANEEFSSQLEGYEAVYPDGDHANSGHKITNKLAGVRKFKVEADWKAAARQGGKAEVTYQVQKLVNGQWQAVEVPDIDENGNMLTAAGGTTTDETQASKTGKLVIKNFQAETMSKSAQFADLPEYNDDGTRIEYRVVQVDVKRTDNTVQSSYSQTFPNTEAEAANGITINLNERTETVGQTSQQKHDEYKLTVAENGDTYKFTYQLVGNTDLVIVKKWNDSAYYSAAHDTALSHSDDTVQAQVQRMNFGATQFEPYTDNDAVDQETKSVLITSIKSEETTGAKEGSSGNVAASPYILTWQRTISVPIYDADGHEYQYQVEELADGFDKSRYTVWVTYDKLTNTYTIENKYTPPGGPSLDFNKEWQDDGDTLHRTAITVHYTDAVGRASIPGENYNQDNETGAAGSTDVDEPNSWKGRIAVRSSYVYDSNNFEEYEGSPDNYKFLNHIYRDMSFTANITIGGLTAGETYKVVNKSGDTELLSETTLATNASSLTVSITNPPDTAPAKMVVKKKVTDEVTNEVTWETVTGISVVYSDNSGVTASVGNDGVISLSYTGVLVKTSADGTSAYNGKAWINWILASQGEGSQNKESLADTNINFVSFDNLVGLYRNGEHYYAVEQVIPTSSDNGRPSYITFKNTRVGVVSYKVKLEWKLGDWASNHPDEQVEVKITPRINGKRIDESGNPIADNDTTTTPLSITKAVNVSNSEFYLTDLPKYNSKGTIIEWELEEIKLAGETIETRTSATSPTGVERSCEIDGNKCVVSVSNTVYNYSTDHHTDDLIEVTLTNRFEGETTATVNKKWYDDNNALGLRSDTYMHLWRRRKGSTGEFEPYGNRYTFNADNNNEWSYTFTNLPQFDDDGYEYEYAIEELEMDDYATEMYSAFSTSNPNNNVVSTLEGRLVPNNGTFTDKISGEVVIKGTKLWENILETLDHSHYPIAQIKLFRRDKYKKNGNGEYILENGKKVETTDTEVDYTQIGSTNIYQGDEKFIFKPNFTKEGEGENAQITGWNPEINSGYYVVDNDLEVNGANGPLVSKVKGVDSLILPKFNDEGELITYKLEEEGINGYAFKVSDDNVVNEYNGGRPVEIEVKKSWDNMNDQSQYPAVELILHQILFAKTTNDKGQILQQDGTYAYDSQDPKLTCVEYNTYKMVLTKDLVEHPTNDLQNTVRKDQDGSWIYTFGKIKEGTKDTRCNSNENLRELAPDGTYFAYYVTEQLINYEDAAVELNALDVTPNPTFLGDFYKASEVPQTGVTVNDSAYGFTIKTYTQPASIENEPDTTILIQRNAEIKNSYEPEIENYEGTLKVTKTWDDKDTAGTENGLNEEFKNVQGYSVTVSRLTSNISEKKIFKIKTGDKDTDVPEVTTAFEDAYENEFQITPGTMTRYPETGNIMYYEAKFQFTKTSYTGLGNQTIPVIFRIYKRRPTDDDYAQMHNKIEISGLAIYGQDATKYTYMITEDTAAENDPMIAFKSKYQLGTNSWIDTPVGQKMEKDTNNVYIAEFGLKNELKVFTLNLYKVFGKKYFENGTEKTAVLEERDYNLYFNDDYVNELRFELWRKEGETGEYKRYNYTDTSIESKISADGADRQYSLNRSGTTYSLQFKNLPKYSPNGKVYYYRVREKAAPEGAKYTTLYTGSRTDIGAPEPQDVTCGENESEKNTYVRNIFEAKQVTINKFWDDNNNIDGLRPTNVKVTVTEHIPAYTPSGSTALSDSDETSIRILKNADQWKQVVEFPQYYYNGKYPVPGLAYSIEETLQHSGGDGAYIYDLPAKGYSPTPVYGYKLAGDTEQRLFDGTTTSVDITGSGGNGDLIELNVTNSKEPINSKLYFDKVWDDDSNKWSLRPKVIYVKLQRNAKDVINITSAKNILIPSSNKDASNTITAEIRNLDNSAEYRVVRRKSDGKTWETVTTVAESTYDYTTFTDNTTGTAEKIKTLTFTLENVGNITEVLKLQKKDGEGDFRDIDVDKDGQKIRVILSSASTAQETVTTNNVGQPAGIKDSDTVFSLASGAITIPAADAVDGKVGVLVEGLPKTDGSGNEYHYRVSGTSTDLVTRDLANDQVSVIAVINVGDSGASLQLEKSTDESTWSNIDDGDITSAVRYFAADSTTGVVALPVNSSVIVNNPGVVFEELNYGTTNSTGTQQSNGTWKPYYYTILECDKKGYDIDSKLKSSQTDAAAATITASVDLSFTIDVSSYTDRKHINIKVTRDGTTPVATDINGKPLRITVDGSDFYASNSDHNTPTLGVIVIPVTAKSGNTIQCVVHDLPYKPYANDTAYTYDVKRCNSSGGGSYANTISAITPTENKVPETTTVEFSKTWSKYAVDSGLKPDTIHLKLCRTYTGGQETDVDGYDQLKDVNVSTAKLDDKKEFYTYTDKTTLAGLPAGGYVSGSDGAAIWRRYTYFLKEYYDSSLTDEKPGSITYEQFKQTKGEDKPFVLSGNNKTAELSEGIKNTISTTKHDVIKNWIDNDDEGNDNGSTKPPSREDYYVVLQRRAGVQGEWENVDLTKTSIQKVEEGTPSVYGGEIISKISTTTDPPSSYTMLKVEKGQLHIRFDQLPYCDDKGAPYQYRAAEVQIGVDQQIREEKTYLFLVPGTHPTDEEYSYVRVVHRGSNNYFVTYNYDPDYVDPDNNTQSSTNYEADDYDYSNFETQPTRIVNKIVNPITFSHIEVKKVWNDEDNVYGRRPQKITFRLTRTKNGDLDNSFMSNKTVGEAENWTCKWEQLAAFAADGGRFEYFVTELPVAGYTTSLPPTESSKTDSGTGETTRLLTFTNTYTPEKEKLTAEKLWDDFSNDHNLRPANVTYELYCKYDVYNCTDTTDTDGKVTGRTYQKQATGYNGPVFDSSKSYAEQSEVFKEIQKQLFPNTTAEQIDAMTVQEKEQQFSDLFVKQLSDTNNWKLEFGVYKLSNESTKNILPSWINPTADGRFNGKAVEVKYYLVETFGANDAAYKKIYNCEASNIVSGTDPTPGTSKDNWVLEKGLVYNTPCGFTNGVYTIPASIAVRAENDQSAKARVLIRDLPVDDGNGNRYEYTVTETDENGYDTSGHIVTKVISPFVDSNDLVTEKKKQEKVDLLITAENVTTDVYFKISCKKTVTKEGYIDNLTGCTFTPNSITQGSQSKVIAYTENHPAGNVEMTISGLPKFDRENNKEYTYSVTEYGSQEPDEAVPLDSTTLTVTGKADDANAADKVTITVKKTNTTVNQHIYFRIKGTTTTESNEPTVLTGKTAQPFLICGADEDPTYQSSETVDGSPREILNEISSANIDVTTPTSADYQKNVLVENNFICVIADGASAEVTVKGLPKKNAFGFDYDYSVAEYNNYSVNAEKKQSTSMTAAAAEDAVDPSKVNVTVTNPSTAKGAKVCFRLVQSVKYSQANSLGEFTVLKSASSLSSSAIRNSLNTRNITVALDWEDNGYYGGGTISEGDHAGELKVNKLHYNTYIKLECNALQKKSGDTYIQYLGEEKIISYLNKESDGNGKRSYAAKYGVVFKDLPKYYLSNGELTVYEYDIKQKIGSEPTEAEYKEQLVGAYDDTANKKVLTNDTRQLGSNKPESDTARVDVLDGTDNGTPTGRRYSYGTTYTSYTDNADGADYVTQYNILNSLPLTAVNAVKHWDDDSDKFKLRPSVPTGNAADPLGIKLETRTGSNTFTDPEYVLSQTAAQRITVDNSANTWTYTYQKLLKSDENNALYEFKITEALDGTKTKVSGYKEPNYNETYMTDEHKDDNQTIKTTDLNHPLENNGNKTWNGTNPLTKTMDITNKLDTRDIIVAKVWEDNGYGGAVGNDTAKALHYDLALTLSGIIPAHNGTAAHALEWKDGDETKASETFVLKKDTVNTDSNSSDYNKPYAVKFIGYPKYDSNGNMIVYTVSESKNTSGKTEATGDHLTTKIDTASTAASNDEFTPPTGDDRKYHYNGTCNKIVDADGCAVQYTITNALPLTKVSVTKHWDDLHNTYGLRPGTDEVTFDLYRTTSSDWAKVTSDGYNKSVVAQTDNSNSDPDTFDTWTFNYDKLLQYSETNALYSYKVKEVYSDTTLGAYELLQTSPDTYVRADVDKSSSGESDNHQLEFTNRLIRSDITVTQTWNEKWGSTDLSSQYQDLRYKVNVQLRSDSSEVGYNENKDIAEKNESNVYLNSNSVTFTDVPLYSKTHTPLTYTVTQTKASSVADGGTLTTQRTDQDDKFIQTSACSNYVATCSSLTDSNGVLQSFTMTNTLPLVHYTAAKEWRDDNNRDGLRPTGSDSTGTFGFNLSRSDTPDLSVDETVNAADWSASFGYYPEYKKDNSSYNYVLTEYGALDFKYKNKYTETSASEKNPQVNETTNGVQTETQYDYSFINTHTPFTGSLKAQKKWEGDDDYYADTRPTSIRFKLQCRKEGETTWVDAESAVYVKGFIDPQYSGYEYTKTINNPETGSNETFEHLPLYVNTSGNTESGYSYNNNAASSTANGTSSKIQYRVVEVYSATLNGYTVTYSTDESTWASDPDIFKWTQSEAESSSVKTEYIKNTLKTTTVTVEKSWEDNSYTKLYNGDHAHYDVNVKIIPVEITSYTGGSAQSITADATGDAGKLTFTGVPLYTKTGAEAQYKLEEVWGDNESNRHYKYDRAYFTTTNEALTGNNSDTFKPAQEKYRSLKVKNTLPLTAVTVTKTWFDNTNAYSLRPDKVTLQLYRTTKTGATFDTVTVGQGQAADGWEPVGNTFDIEKLDGVTQNTWTKEISNLLKYDYSNNEYVFKVEEAEVKGYSTVYDNPKLTTTDSKALGVTNTWKTRSVKIIKQWADGGYSDAALLHYDTYMKLHVDHSGTAIPEDISFEGLIDIDNNDANLRDNVTFTNVPAYDREGNPINYSISESPDDNSHYGSTHYGYVKTDGTPHAWSEDANVYDQYTVINTLPLTKVKVTKDWEYLDVYPAHEPTAVAVDITRTGVNPPNNTTSSTASTDVIIHPSSTTSIPAPSSGVYSADTDFDNELVYDYNNAPYTYSVLEPSLIVGFEFDSSSSTLSGSTVTTENGTTTIVNTVELTLKNKEITHDISLTKIDGTYEDLYKRHNNYSDLTLSGAKFNLYKTKEGESDRLCYVTVSSGTYTFDGTTAKYDAPTEPHTQTNTTDIVSVTGGLINIEGLPLGTYKLVEIEAPTGYEINSTPYTFTLSVDGSNQSNDTFSGDKKIRNEEKKATATLVKQDAVTNAPITTSKATYYMLRLIPRTVTSSETPQDVNAANEAYLTSAKNAIANYKFDATTKATLESYWDIAKTVQTGENGSVEITLIEHGTYAFLECQAPVGYEINNQKESYSVNDTASTDVFTINENNHSQSFTIVHSDPRKTASVDIYKQDEFENPLNGAQFDLYYDPPKRNVTPLSDYDYIFFTDNWYYETWHDASDEVWGTVYAYFYNASGAIPETGVFPGVRLDETYPYWLNHAQQKVYKIQPPTGATGVVFSVGNEYKQTVDIDITDKSGYGYYKTGITNGKYEVSQNWYHAQVTGSSLISTVSYDTYGDCIYIKNDSAYIGNDQKWDDLHIYFSDSEGNVVGQSSPGYSMPKPTEIGGEYYFKFEIPIGATKFTVTNGNKEFQDTNNHKWEISNIAITPYAGYAFNNSGGMDVVATGLGTPVSTSFTQPIRVARVTTGDDGLTSAVEIINSNYAEPDSTGGKLILKKWGDYYWQEVTNPTGYNGGTDPIPFSIGTTEADKTVNVYKASNARLMGKVVLTKTAREKVGDIDVGGRVKGAKFNLHNAADTAAEHPLTLEYDSLTGYYNVKTNGTVTDLVTGDDGTIKIGNLDWGQYYLKEISAPTGFAVNANDKVNFTVGRNNCGEIPQQLSFKDPAVKAQINIAKTIDVRNDEAWGDPTFIFKIKQTHTYGTSDDMLTEIPAADQPVKVVSLTLESTDGINNDGKDKSTDYFDVDPGTYEITEVSVSRYQLKDGSFSDETNVRNETFTNGKATFTVKAGGKVTVTFKNELQNYDKLSHVDCEVNNFHGYKGIRVEYKGTIPISGDSQSIRKTSLDVYKIMSDGSETKLDPNNIDDAEFMNSITYTYVGKTGDDPRFGTGTQPDFTDDVSNNRLMIGNPSRYTDGVYTLRASYEGLTSDFDIHFASADQSTKVYERTVVFKADDSNMSYFDEGDGTAQYAFVFTMAEKQGAPGQYYVHTIKHNGEVIATGTEDDIGTTSAIAGSMNQELTEVKNKLKANEAYAKQFQCWTQGGAELTLGQPDYAALMSIVTNSNSAEVTTYTAKLQDIPTSTNP